MIFEEKTDPFRVVRKMTVSNEGLRDAGGTVVVSMSHHCDNGSIRAVIWLKLPWSHVGRMLFSLTPPKHHRFTRDTLVFFCSYCGLMRGGPY